MLLLGSKQWRLFPLSVQLLSSAKAGLLVGLPQPPPHMPVTVAPVEVACLPVPAEAVRQASAPCTPSRCPHCGTASHDLMVRSDKGRAACTGFMHAQDLPVAVDDEDVDEGPLAEAGSACDAEELGSFSAAEDEDTFAAAAEAGGPVPDKQALKCSCCGEAAKQRWIGCACGARTHLECLAQHYMEVCCTLCACHFSFPWPRRSSLALAGFMSLAEDDMKTVRLAARASWSACSKNNCCRRGAVARRA